MKHLLLTALLCLIAVSAFAGEFWIDSNLETNGNGTEVNPFNSMITPESVITPGTVHTINLKGSDVPYSGGFGGHNLKRWLFGKCTIVKDESNGKTVKFEPCRSIPFDQLTDGPIAGTKLLYVHPRFKWKGKRLYADMDSRELVLTRPVYLGKDRDNGFEWDAENSRVIVTPALVLGKTAHTTRRAKLKQMKVDYLASLKAAEEVASNPDLLDEIEVSK